MTLCPFCAHQQLIQAHSSALQLMSSRTGCDCTSRISADLRTLRDRTVNPEAAGSNPVDPAIQSNHLSHTFLRPKLDCAQNCAHAGLTPAHLGALRTRVLDTKVRKGLKILVSAVQSRPCPPAPFVPDSVGEEPIDGHPVSGRLFVADGVTSCDLLHLARRSVSLLLARGRSGCSQGIA